MSRVQQKIQKCVEKQKARFLFTVILNRFLHTFTEGLNLQNYKIESFSITIRQNVRSKYCHGDFTK